MKWLLVVLTLVPLAWAAVVYDCPLDWQRYQDNCYKFVFYPTRTYTQALTVCQNDGASMVSVNTPEEHTFLSGWLIAHTADRSSRWWTSGSGPGGSLVWLGDGSTELPPDEGGWTTPQPWLSDEDKDNGNDRVVYAFSEETNAFMWSRAPFSSSINFICETKRSDAFRINHIRRDFTYGSNQSDLNVIERGPYFVDHEKDVVVVGTPLAVSIDCIAQGNPDLTYRWYRSDGSTTWIEVDTQSERYGLTKGRIIINDPDRAADEGTYRCLAQNKFGSVLGDPVKLSFGYIMEFSNTEQGEVRALRYQGTVLNCVAPSFNPAVTYHWYKGSASSFVRPELNPHMFISHNGKLYISETQDADGGPYRCIVTLTSLPGDRLTTVQPPSRTSLDIRLVIEGDTATNFGPNIHNDFPAVFPSTPLSGQDLRLECLAYGRLPLTYTWERVGEAMPPRINISDHGRVLTIFKASLDDSGEYRCLVRRRSEASDFKSLSLSVQAKPYFLLPLPNMHVDVNSAVTWRCEAEAVPSATYSWFKDTVPLTSVPGDVEVQGNVLTIHRADAARHAGMYQCAATNRHGTALSGAQLRVLAFKPNFSKLPVKETFAAIGGNATIVCQPEAAPMPEIEWSLNGRSLGLTPGGEGRVKMLYNGNLEISPVQSGDQGLYKCLATNNLGSASSNGTLILAERTVLSVTPANTQVVVNSSSFLACQASWNSLKNDLVYLWKFNGHVINVEDDMHFAQGRREGDGAGTDGLFVQNAQFEHSGTYTCSAQTIGDFVEASAVLTVLGPPSEPAGVMASVLGRSVSLMWTNGDKHGRDIISYDIEFRSNYSLQWQTYVKDLREEDALNPLYPDKRTATVLDLSPGTEYDFRVTAKNELGASPASKPSKKVSIPSGPPLKAPEKVGGGGGTVGTLVITWKPLNPEDQGGSNLGYVVRWRRDPNTLWRTERVHGNEDKYVALVGVDNYYLEYEVMVTAFNDLGEGPNSTITVIYSAEDMPVAQPRNLWCNAYNGTAMTYGWDPIPSDRKNMKGRIVGVQINFWLFQTQEKERKSFIYGDVTEGLVVGLLPNLDYTQNMQVFNGAGLGPKSDNLQECSTNGEGPLKYPEYVSVYSHDADSVFVQWRGISTGLDEEALRGYKMRYWRMSESMSSAVDVIVKRPLTYGVISGLEKGVIYILRVTGFNSGGDGKKAPPVLFTLGGQVRYNPATSEVLAAGSRLTPTLLTVVVMAITSLLWK